MEEHIKELRRVPQPVPEPLRNILSVANADANRFRPDLSTIRTLEEARTPLIFIL